MDDPANRQVLLPRLYAILDAAFFPTDDQLIGFAEGLAAAGVGLLQYRNKTGTPRQMLDHAYRLRKCLAPSVRLIMNDRADLCVASRFDGLHVGHDDLSPESARIIIGPHRWLGVSTHNASQIVDADRTSTDYIAVGPIFPTYSKAAPDPVIGLEGVRQARALTRKPLVAIGGITCENCRDVIDAGADSVAVISGLMGHPRQAAEDFFRILR